MHKFSFNLLKILQIGYEKTDFSVNFNDYNSFNENNHWGKMTQIEKKATE